jgi:hypothetical protein
MIINNRECEEKEIGEYKFYFLSRFRGKEFVKALKTKMAKQIDTSSIGEDNKVKIDMSIEDLYNDLIPLFPVFCVKMTELTGEDIEVSKETLLELETDTFNSVIDVISDLLIKVIGGEKKVMKQSEV